MMYPVTASPVDRVLAAQERLTVVPTTVADGRLPGRTVAANTVGAPPPVETNAARAAEGSSATPISKQRRTRVFTPSPPFRAGAAETLLPGTRRAPCTAT